MSNLQNSAASTLLSKPKGQEYIEYLSPNAGAWSGLPRSADNETSNVGRTYVAVASAPIIGPSDATAACSIVFLTGRHGEIYWGGPFFPPEGSGSWYVPSSQLVWNQLDGFSTNRALAAAVFDYPDSPGSVPQQFLVLFGTGVSFGDIRMNVMPITTGPPPPPPLTHPVSIAK